MERRAALGEGGGGSKEKGWVDRWADEGAEESWRAGRRRSYIRSQRSSLLYLDVATQHSCRRCHRGRATGRWGSTGCLDNVTPFTQEMRAFVRKRRAALGGDNGNSGGDGQVGECAGEKSKEN